MSGITPGILDRHDVYIYLVSAVTVFGDPTFTHGQSFDAGTDTSSDGVSGSVPWITEVTMD
jgi:hypothetical protein